MSTPATYNTNPAERRIITLVHSAIAGASIAATLELASRELLSPLLLTALGCFAIAIPSAVALVILSQIILELGKTQPEVGIHNQAWPLLSYILAVVDQLACYGGFLLVFWHFHWVVGIIFLAATAIAYLMIWMAEKSLREKKKQVLDVHQDPQPVTE